MRAAERACPRPAPAAGRAGRRRRARCCRRSPSRRSLRYQTESQRASGASTGSASACVSAGVVELVGVLRARGRRSQDRTRARRRPPRGAPPCGRTGRSARRPERLGVAHGRDCARARGGSLNRHAGRPFLHSRDVETTSDWINAGVAIVVAIVIARIVDRGCREARRERRRAGRARRAVARATQTRLRLVRRLVSRGHHPDRRRARGVAIRRAVERRHGHPRLLRGARPGGRLRRPPDARERDRRDPARDHAADPDRRPRDLRGARPARSRTCSSPTPTSASTTAAA